MKTLAVIPARMASTRFPGKPLANIQGIPMVVRVAILAKQANRIDDVVVATDDETILRVVQEYGHNALLTSPDHRSGFDRLVETSIKLPGYGAYINVQGDEPLIDPGVIDSVTSLLANPGCSISTSAIPIQNEEDYLNPNIVKVVFDSMQKALYFSRSPIPHYRDKFAEKEKPWKHQGIYGFRSEVLPELSSLEPSALEIAESLEQLRFLQNGFSICVTSTNKESIGVDMPADIEKVIQALSES